MGHHTGDTTERPCHHKIRHPHGTDHGYTQDRCRCAPCRAARMEVQRRYRRRLALAQWGQAPNPLVDSRGTARRLQALAIEGWSAEYIAAALGYGPNGQTAVCRYRLGRLRRVTHATATAVRDLFEELGREPQPQTPGAKHTRLIAQRHEWVPALAWNDIDLDDAPAASATPRRGRDLAVDEVVVDELVTGARTAANASRKERLTAVERLTRRGLSSKEIAALIGVHRRAVVRDRADLGLTAVDTDVDVDQDVAA